MAYDIYNTSTGARIHTNISVEDAAAIIEVDEDELMWAIEEYGECETDVYAATPHTTEARTHWL